MSDNPAESSSEANLATRPPVNSKTYLPGRRFYGVILVVTILGFVVQWKAEWIAEFFPFAGRALSNILILPLILIALISWMRWFLLGSVYRWPVKVLVVLGIVSLPFLLKVEHSGDLFSLNVRLRMLAPDQLLALPEVQGDAGNRTENLFAKSTPFGGMLGSDRSGTLPDVELSSWSEFPPELLWTKEVGAGWSGFSAARGLAFTQEQRGDQELVTAYDIRSGNVIWFHTETARHVEEMGGIGPRATPTIDGDQVFAQGATGILVCLELETGKLLWRRNVVEDVDSTRADDAVSILWGRSGSPWVEENLVIVPGGGRNQNFVSLIAYDRTTGEIVWKGGDQQISYSSPVGMTLDGQRQIVIVNESTVSGHDPQSGKQQWTHSRPGTSNTASNTSQPQQVDENHLLVSKGYGLGAELLEIRNSEEGVSSVKSEWASPRVLRTKLTSAIVHNDVAFGLNDGILECIDLKDGSRLWKGKRYRHGQLLNVGKNLILLSESGDLFQIPATKEKSVPSQAVAALSGTTWNNLCLWGNYLLVRNARQAACFRLKFDSPNVQDAAEDPSESSATE